ncbi:hypothetical protein LAV72_23635 [Lysinibacillus xylanilyticus]|uniref:hypothetical protein n=1 Tax=Lysinibacillus xylanilyticus TaxID=582475 RepID=UPI002B253736|nr:hypothetical protein [Lysinibacillus xylanilyticus]MEB2302597.1 hypothetical protein [Lysinibacillus xylanilyticus]
MIKVTKKSWVIVSALTIGMAVFTPHQAEATTATTTANEMSVQAEQQIKGTIEYIDAVGIDIKGQDSKAYYIGMHKFSDEQIEKMNLVEGQEISVEGSLVEDYYDLYTFDAYKKGLPKEITKEDLAKLEKLFNQMEKLQKEEKYDEANKIDLEMDKIILASWVPVSFEEFIKEYEFSEKNIVIKENDKKQLKAIYEQGIQLEKAGKREAAQENYGEFLKIFQPYLDALYPPVTFEEYLSDMKVDILDIPAEALPKLKTIYDDAQKEDNDILFVTFGEMIRPYVNFEDYLSDFDFEIKATDKKQLKQLYEEAAALDKKGDSEKSNEKWAAFDKILDSYYEPPTLISASKVTINGNVYLTQHINK